PEPIRDDVGAQPSESEEVLSTAQGGDWEFRGIRAPKKPGAEAMKGFFYPRSATGQSSLLPPPPWHYSGDLLTIEYRTDPKKIAALLPEPLTLADEDPGAAALIWADWQSCGDTKDELLDPIRAQ